MIHDARPSASSATEKSLILSGSEMYLDVSRCALCGVCVGSYDEYAVWCTWKGLIHDARPSASSTPEKSLVLSCSEMYLDVSRCALCGVCVAFVR